MGIPLRTVSGFFVEDLSQQFGIKDLEAYLRRAGVPLLRITGSWFVSEDDWVDFFRSRIQDDSRIPSVSSPDGGAGSPEEWTMNMASWSPPRQSLLKKNPQTVDLITDFVRYVRAQDPNISVVQKGWVISFIRSGSTVGLKPRPRYGFLLYNGQDELKVSSKDGFEAALTYIRQS